MLSLRKWDRHIYSEWKFYNKRYAHFVVQICVTGYKKNAIVAILFRLFFTLMPRTPFLFFYYNKRCIARNCSELPFKQRVSYMISEMATVQTH